MAKLLPVILAVIGLAGGIGAGLLLAPPPEEDAALPPCAPVDGTDAAQIAQPAPVPVAQDVLEVSDQPKADREYVKLNNQFVVPVVKQGKVAALVVMSLSVEVDAGGREGVFQREPKLRDQFLQVLFDHANAGGFDDNFTSGLNMAALRSGLVSAAQQVMGPVVSDVLIQDIARQDHG